MVADIHSVTRSPQPSRLLRCYRELLVIDWIKNILDFDSLWFPRLVTDVSGQPIRQKFMGQVVEEKFFLACLSHSMLHKISEEGRYHSQCGRILRPNIKLSCDWRSVINSIYVCRNRMYKLMVTAAVQNVGRLKITGITPEETFSWKLILFIGRILQFRVRIHLNSLFYWSRFNYFSLPVNLFKQ